MCSENRNQFLRGDGTHSASLGTAATSELAHTFVCRKRKKDPKSASVQHHAWLKTTRKTTCGTLEGLPRRLEPPLLLLPGRLPDEPLSGRSPTPPPLLMLPPPPGSGDGVQLPPFIAPLLLLSSPSSWFGSDSSSPSVLGSSFFQKSLISSSTLRVPCVPASNDFPCRDEQVRLR